MVTGRSRYSDSLTRVADLPLRGAGGEPVDFARTIVSHGVAELPPNHVDLAGRSFETTLLVPGGVRTVRLTESGGKLRTDVVSGRVGVKSRDELAATVAHMFRLDENLSGFYAAVSADGDLSWCASGAGRMLRAPTVFEDVVKTICTTNTAWSGTRKMTHALVDNLGAEAPGGGRTFPTPQAMAEMDVGFYRQVVRAGYRVAARLLALPGVGPYAAAHVMLTSLGRYSRLVLDSWTRPTYYKLSGARSVLKDATIERRFKHYGEWAGLAFWLYLTQGWVEDGLPV